MLILLAITGLAAGMQNALAGGGSFLTLAALVFTGLDARGANITSTVALFPGQVTTGLAGRRLVGGAAGLSFRSLMAISLAGGALGGLLLLATPSAFFARLVPWLILFATSLFAWGTFRGRPQAVARPVPRPAAAAVQFLIAVYGGYFGGGIGFLMLAALILARVPVRQAEASKNVLAGVMNAAAVAIFAFSHEVRWLDSLVLGLAAIAGGQIGVWLLHRVRETWLRLGVVAVGVALTVAMFLRAS
jgi:uncharacterized membrane protein YfcA